MSGTGGGSADLADHHPSARLRADWAAAALSPGASLAMAIHFDACAACAIRAQAMNELLEPRADGNLAARLKMGAIPAPLRGKTAGRWRWLGPGVKACRIEGVSGLGEAVWLVKTSRGARLRFPAGHAAQLVVVDGGFVTQGVLFGAGDFFDLESRPLPPARAGDQGCVLLVVTDGAPPADGLGALVERLVARFRRT